MQKNIDENDLSPSPDLLEEESGVSENNAGAGDDEEEEFSFDCGGASCSPIAAEDIFVDGQIKTVFPVFNRDLFFSVEDLRDGLPSNPPVKNVFVETARPATSSSPPRNASCEWSDRKAVEASPEVCKKSNSTGFSKIWRFKDLLGRSNSDGRDTFVFLNHGHSTPPPAAEGDRKEGKLKLKGKEKKGKAAPVSAHEAYLKSKAKGGEQRRSYLPYRPELMGFFTNVNGGMTKNVHPF